MTKHVFLTGATGQAGGDVLAGWVGRGFDVVGAANWTKAAIRILFAGCVLFSSFFLGSRAQAQASPFTSEEILDYHSDIRVQQDASLLVRETIRVRSAGVEIQHGIYRDFPTRYKDRLGNRYVIHFEVVEVSRDGQPEKFHVARPEQRRADLHWG